MSQFPEDASPRHSPVLLGIAGLVGILVLGAAGAFFFLDITSPWTLVRGARTEREVPPTLRPYYTSAMAGDAGAMRMLGTMYYNGLNVPRDTKEGIRWFRKAAAAGSVAAKKDLEQLGLSVPEK